MRKRGEQTGLDTLVVHAVNDVDLEDVYKRQVLFCNRDGTEVAAAHAGWRGLCEGVLEATVARFADKAENIMAWLGPAIGPQAFEVGPEVRDAFMAKDKNCLLYTSRCV